MKHTGILVALAALVLTSVSAYSAESYIRPELLWSKGDLDGVKSNKFGFGLAGGAKFGIQNEHDVSLSVSQTNFTDGETYSVVVGSVRSTGTSSVKIQAVPIMVNYRYVFSDKGAKFRPYVGPSIGVMSAKIELKGSAVATIVGSGAVIGSANTSESKSKTPLNFGATLGAVYQITDSFSLDVGYRYSQAKIEVSEWDLDGDLKIHSLVLGGTFRF